MLDQLFRLVVVFTIVLSPMHSSGDALDDFERLSAIADAEFRNIVDVELLETPPFMHEKRLKIEAHNLEDPWVSNQQCHANFPLFPDLQIAFSPGAVRSMRITQQARVEAAWIEGATVQMKQTRPETLLCFASENRVFHRDADSDTYRLRVGPFYLRLFDGYFPLQVDLKISYPEALLALVNVLPDPVEGAILRVEEGEIHWENVFEGRLELEFVFSKR